MDNAEQMQVAGQEEEAATEPAVSAVSMDQLLVESYEMPALKVGDILDGTILSITPTEITVDVGGKTEGIIAGHELERLSSELAAQMKVGDQIVTSIVRSEDKDGHIVLSLARAQQERDWREAERLFQTQQVFEATVSGFNRGGLVVRMGKVRGFVPTSQLVSIRPLDVAEPVPAASSEGQPEAEAPVVAEGAVSEQPAVEVAATSDSTMAEQRLAQMVGEKLHLKVIEIDRRRNRLILSERLAMREWRKEQKERLLNELKRGDVRSGIVTSLQPFGAFVDLGGADGLIHLSELSWSRVNHPSEVLQVGQQVEVYVLNVDPEKRRIGLSLRRLAPEPWSVVAQKYKVGQIIEGVITKLSNFGAFARIDAGVEGLIHISELAKHRVTHPKEVVKEGETLQLRIIRIDPSRRRIGLSLKRVADEDYAEYDWEVEGDELDGEVSPDSSS